jgi:hypothetical protein
MSSNGDIPFESDADSQLRGRTASLEDTPRVVSAFVDQQGQARPERGTLVAPYENALGRASSDGTTGSVSVDSGQDQRVLVDQLGRIWIRRIIDPVVITGTITADSEPIVADRYVSSAFEIQHSIVAGAKALRVGRITMLVKAGVAADRTLMVFDSDVAVVNGAVPTWRTELPNAGASVGECWDVFDEFVFICGKGITVAISTTPDTLTLDTANALFGVLYKAVP